MLEREVGSSSSGWCSSERAASALRAAVFAGAPAAHQSPVQEPPEGVAGDAEVLHRLPVPAPKGVGVNVVSDGVVQVFVVRFILCREWWLSNASDGWKCPDLTTDVYLGTRYVDGNSTTMLMVFGNENLERGDQSQPRRATLLRLVADIWIGPQHCHEAAMKAVCASAGVTGGGA